MRRKEMFFSRDGWGGYLRVPCFPQSRLIWIWHLKSIFWYNQLKRSFHRIVFEILKHFFWLAAQFSPVQCRRLEIWTETVETVDQTVVNKLLPAAPSAQNLLNPPLSPSIKKTYPLQKTFQSNSLQNSCFQTAPHPLHKVTRWSSPDPPLPTFATYWVSWPADPSRHVHTLCKYTQERRGGAQRPELRPIQPCHRCEERDSRWNQVEHSKIFEKNHSVCLGENSPPPRDASFLLLRPLDCVGGGGWDQSRPLFPQSISPKPCTNPCQLLFGNNFSVS